MNNFITDLIIRLNSCPHLEGGIAFTMRTLALQFPRCKSVMYEYDPAARGITFFMHVKDGTPSIEEDLTAIPGTYEKLAMAAITSNAPLFEASTMRPDRDPKPLATPAQAEPQPSGLFLTIRNSANHYFVFGIYDPAQPDRIFTPEEHKFLKIVRELLRSFWERHSILSELEVRTRAAEQANRAKAEFFAAINHEIRTPMNSIIGNIQLAQHVEGLPLSLYEYLQQASESATHLMGIINNVVEMSKIEVGQTQIVDAPFNFSELMITLGQHFEKLSSEKGLRFTLETTTEVPEILSGDPQRVRQIISNLISNAIKFTPEGHISVTIEACAMPAEMWQIIVQVRDTGIGIPARELPYVFDLFRKTKASRFIGGAGIGLGLCRKLANLMGGTVTAASVEGEGSRLTFTFIARGEPSIATGLVEPGKNTLARATSAPSGSVRSQAVFSPLYVLRKELPPQILNKIKDLSEMGEISILESLAAELEHTYPLASTTLKNLARNFQTDLLSRVLDQE